MTTHAHLLERPSDMLWPDGTPKDGPARTLEHDHPLPPDKHHTHPYDLDPDREIDLATLACCGGDRGCCD